MPKRAASPKTVKDSSANLGFEAKLWLAADSRPLWETIKGSSL
jgi:hypothetical protein